jgi:hypothetical protein
MLMLYRNTLQPITKVITVPASTRHIQQRRFFTAVAIILITIIASLTAFSQHQKLTASIDIQLAVPQGEYGENNKDVGFGARFNGLWKPKETIPMKLGLELGFQTYGTRREYFDAFVLGFYDRYEVSATNNVVSLTFLTRLQSGKHRKLKPFLDGIFGWNVFFSSVTVERQDDFNNNFNGNYNDSRGNSTKARWAFTYGAAGGIDIPLSKVDDVGLELKLAYLRGANTKYLTNPRIDANGAVYFTEKESETNMLIPQLGVRINL